MIAPFRFDHVTFTEHKRRGRISHRRVAEAAGRPMSWARKLARGERCPTWDELDALAKLLKLGTGNALAIDTEDPAYKAIVDEDESETRRANGESGARSLASAMVAIDNGIAEQDRAESFADEIGEEIEHVEDHGPAPTPSWLEQAQAANPVEGS